MRADDARSMACRNARPADDERYVDVGLVRAFFARMHSPLANVEAVIRCVENVGVVQQPLGIELLDELLDHLVDSLQRSKTRTLKLIVVLDDCVIQLR